MNLIALLKKSWWILLILVLGAVVFVKSFVSGSSEADKKVDRDTASSYGIRPPPDSLKPGTPNFGEPKKFISDDNSQSGGNESANISSSNELESDPITEDLEYPKSNCAVFVDKVTSYTVGGKSVGFYVIFYNNSPNDVDAIDYQVIFRNTFGENLKSFTESWVADDLSNPIPAGKTKSNLRLSWVDGATKTEVKIIRVHFTKGTTCWE